MIRYQSSIPQQHPQAGQEKQINANSGEDVNRRLGGQQDHDGNHQGKTAEAQEHTNNSPNRMEEDVVYLRTTVNRKGGYLLTSCRVEPLHPRSLQAHSFLGKTVCYVI